MSKEFPEQFVMIHSTSNLCSPQSNRLHFKTVNNWQHVHPYLL